MILIAALISSALASQLSSIIFIVPEHDLLDYIHEPVMIKNWVPGHHDGQYLMDKIETAFQAAYPGIPMGFVSHDLPFYNKNRLLEFQHKYSFITKKPLKIWASLSAANPNLYINIHLHYFNFVDEYNVLEEYAKKLDRDAAFKNQQDYARLLMWVSRFDTGLVENTPDTLANDEGQEMAIRDAKIAKSFRIARVRALLEELKENNMECYKSLASLEQKIETCPYSAIILETECLRMKVEWQAITKALNGNGLLEENDAVADDLGSSGDLSDKYRFKATETNYSGSSESASFGI